MVTDGMVKAAEWAFWAKFREHQALTRQELAELIDKHGRPDFIRMRAALEAAIEAQGEEEDTPFLRAPLPVPADIMEARAQGRAEALAILLGESAEDFDHEYMGNHPIADTGDYGMHWQQEKLAKLLRADDSTWSLTQAAEAEYWHNLGLREAAQREYNVAASPITATREGVKERTPEERAADKANMREESMKWLPGGKAVIALSPPPAARVDGLTQEDLRACIASIENSMNPVGGLLIHKGWNVLLAKLRALATNPSGETGRPELVVDGKIVFRNMPDGATFEEYRDNLALGRLTPVDQMAFDNVLHDRLAGETAAPGDAEKWIATNGKEPDDWERHDYLWLRWDNGRMEFAEAFGTIAWHETTHYMPVVPTPPAPPMLASTTTSDSAEE